MTSAKISPRSTSTWTGNAPELPRKAMLMEERELIGTYVSEHPLQASLMHLQNLVTRQANVYGGFGHRILLNPIDTLLWLRID